MNGGLHIQVQMCTHIIMYVYILVQGDNLRFQDTWTELPFLASHIMWQVFLQQYIFA